MRNFYGTLRFLSKGIIQTPRGVVTLIPHTYIVISGKQESAKAINKPRHVSVLNNKDLFTGLIGK